MVLKILLAQLGLSVVFAALFWALNGHIAGYSALLGGLTCVVPNAFLALRLAVPRRDPGAGRPGNGGVHWGDRKAGADRADVRHGVHAGAATCGRRHCLPDLSARSWSHFWGSS